VVVSVDVGAVVGSEVGGEVVGTVVGGLVEVFVGEFDVISEDDELSESTHATLASGTNSNITSNTKTTLFII